MDNSEFHYFIIFDTYEDAMAMHDALDIASIANRISPAPLDIVDGVSCGVSLMIMPIDYDKLIFFLQQNNHKYKKLVKAERTLKPHRDKYC